MGQGFETRKSAARSAEDGDLAELIAWENRVMIGVCAGRACARAARYHGQVQRNVCGSPPLNAFWAALGRCRSEYGGSGFETARGARYRRHRAGRRLSRRIPAWPRLHRAWRQAAVVLVQHRAHRSSLRRPAHRQCAVPAALRRHDGFDQFDPADAADPADRDLQSCGTEPCRRQLREPGIYRQCRRDRRAAIAGSDPDSRHGEGNPLLPGLDLGTLWPGAGSAAKGDHPVLPALALWRRQAVRLLDHGELP